MSNNTNNKKSLDDGFGCLPYLIFMVMAMPFVGLYLILTSNGDSEKKVIGWVLLVVGTIILIAVKMTGSSSS